MTRANLAFALAAAASLLLAGCVGTAQATAMSTRTPADDAAKRWDPNAELVAVVGMEGSWGSSSGNPFGAWTSSGTSASDWSRSSQDGKVGDGRCETWMYRYVSPTKSGAYVVIVDRDGKVTKEGPDKRKSDDVALGAWQVDSDRALEAAKNANAGLKQGVESANFGFVSILHRDDDYTNAVWLIAGGGGDSTGGGGGMAIVDAVNGAVLSSRGGYSGMEGFHR